MFMSLSVGQLSNDFIARRQRNSVIDRVADILCDHVWIIIIIIIYYY